MKCTLILTMLLALAASSIACNDKQPAEVEATKPVDKAKDEKPKADEKPKVVRYFKNPAPPFEVTLGEAEQEAPAAEFLDSGQLRVPLLYREWIFVGSRLVAGTDTTFENYYMHPRHYHAFLKDHAWPSQIVLVRERFESKTNGTDTVMGEPRGVSVAVYDGRAETGNGGWSFFGFGETYPLANSAPPDGRVWFDSTDALLEFCPVLRGVKR